MDDQDWPDDWDGSPDIDEERRRWLDDVLDLLANSRRRDVLYYLASTELTDVGTLAEEMAALDEGCSVDEVPQENRKRIQIELVHMHLPKLDDAGAIEFDPRSEIIRCREVPRVLRIVLKNCMDIEVEDSIAS